MSRKGKVVCVTGGSGFIASWLVKLLLQRGYTVKATVSDLCNPRKTDHLCALDGAEERLYLFKANLVDEGAFDPIVEGCEVTCNGRPLTPDVVVDETWYSDPAFCEQNKLWYMLSKTLAEDAAWKFAKEYGIDLVTINPGWVIGPFLQPMPNLTLEIILNRIKGQTFPNENLRFVDVRDIANAHLLAFEKPEASGRYCLVERVAHLSEFLKILCKQYPTMCVPEKCSDDKPFVPKYEVSKEKIKALGLDFTPLEVTARDTIECFKEKGFINI
ncbi:phenylacetaldehyde reductase-like isoform X3 [Ricinus communis]|uniref:phenylacetaldehyde reductase-like isoform X3 n=1 Tax=Ricinus communis TaxID=3988 RepID=UPI00077244B6|nr:phenylacetaldehyde reductase-like isoform X3 [Ricinus communis]|eukprot:XP_015573870.1 cinnamoyl-CoA reductase 1-like isoform X3 [Ricinus communis]